MQDTKLCPICGNRLRTRHLKAQHLFWIEKRANYIERTCSKGMNHFLQMFVDGYNKKIDVLEVSLDPGYSRCLQMDFVNRRCRVVCRKENKPEYINVPKMIEPDFPDLNRLKEKVSMYVVFS